MSVAYPFEAPDLARTFLESGYVDRDHKPPWKRYGQGSLHQRTQPHHICCLEDWRHRLSQCHETLKMQVFEIEEAISRSHLSDPEKGKFNRILSGLDTTTDYMGRLIEDVSGLLHWSSATWSHDPVIHPSLENCALDISVWVEQYFEWHNIENGTSGA